MAISNSCDEALFPISAFQAAQHGLLPCLKLAVSALQSTDAGFLRSHVPTTLKRREHADHLLQQSANFRSGEVSTDHLFGQKVGEVLKSGFRIHRQIAVVRMPHIDLPTLAHES